MIQRVVRVNQAGGSCDSGGGSGALVLLALALALVLSCAGDDPGAGSCSCFGFGAVEEPTEGQVDNTDIDRHRH